MWHVGAARGNSAAAIEEQLAELAGAVGSVRRVLGAISERLIVTRAHERLCYARLADYARERLGLSARQLQELARVHRALARLPALEASLLANELPWSKLRLIARVATAEDEEAWIARARAVPTRRLEREVRRIGGEEAPEIVEEGGPEKRVLVRCTPAVREKWSLAREMAERVVEGRGDTIRDLYPNAWVDHYPFEAAHLEPGSDEQRKMALRYAPARALDNDRAGPRDRPVEDLIAMGPGSLRPAGAARSDGSGRRSGEGWEVVITRPLPGGLEGGGRSVIAFAVWNGAQGEVGSRKMRSGWIPLAVERAR